MCKSNSSIEESTYTSVKDFEKEFKDFLTSRKIVTILPLKNGYRSLMKALKIWLGSDALTYQVVENKNDKFSKHTYTRLGDYFIDENGVATYTELNNLWLYDYLLMNVFIRKFDPDTELDPDTGEKPFYIENDKINILVQEFDKRFDKEKVLTLFMTKN